MGEFVDVYSKATGRKHRVPAHWMDNPVLSKPFRKSPRTRAAEQEPPVGEDPTAPVTDDASATSATTETPAAGDTKEK